VAGLFSLFLIIGAAFLLVAPNTGETRRKTVAIAVGAILGFGLAFIAPLFR
jgi:hypothetical protein